MEISYSKQATKFLNKLDNSNRQRIESSISKLPYGDIKKLKGGNLFRLRVGSFRVIFDRDFNVISVIEINNRGQIY